MVLSKIYLLLVFLVSSLILCALRSALSNYSEKKLSEIFLSKPLHPLKWFSKTFTSGDNKLFIHLISLTKQISLLSFYTSSMVYFISNFIPQSVSERSFTLFFFFIPSIILASIALIIIGLSKALANAAPLGVLKVFSYPSFVPLFFFLPLTYPIIFLHKKFSKKEVVDLKKTTFKGYLLDLLSNESICPIDSIKKRFIHSLAHFDEKSCREIMIPRIKIQCLQDTSSIFEAVTLFIEEGYSRLPVFENSIDHITGVLLYKDVLEYTFKRGLHNIEDKKKTSIKSLVTPILYAPENKKIPELFQVMRARKIHAAIIVNEYGCTEGLVTIEDIVEELIGSEIFDEHDEEDELIYKKTHDMGWIIEANISIIDAEREFGIKLPQHSEYETIGGFISTTMGIIPKPGSTIHFDGYDIKVLSSNERRILKVKITAS